MRKTLLATAALASLTAFTTAARADLTSFALQTNDAVTTLTYSFSNLAFDGFEFLQPFAVTSLVGRLTAVSINATLNASFGYTYADDLTIYVDRLPLSTGGLLQVGGFSDLSATERHSWANGGSSAPGTTVRDTVTLSTPLTFAGNSTDPAVWLGNGYGDPDASGLWSGSISLTFESTTPPVTAVPEPSSWALLAAGGLAVAGVARRRRTAAA